MVAVGLILAAGLVLFGAATASRQRRTLRRLRGEKYLPSDDRAYLRGQVRRRLVTAGVVAAIGGMIGTYNLSGKDARKDAIADRPHNAADLPPPDAAEKEFTKFVAAYWIAVLGLVFAVGCLAVFDFWAARRYWMAQYKLIKADHEAKLQRDLAVYRQTKDNDRMSRIRGNKPDDADDPPPPD